MSERMGTEIKYIWKDQQIEKDLLIELMGVLKYKKCL